MTTLVPMTLADGASVYIEAESVGPVTRGRGTADTAEKAGVALEDVLKRLGPAVKGVVGELRSAADWPGEVEVELAIKLSADANVIIARTGGEANFRILLRWSRAQHDE